MKFEDAVKIVQKYGYHLVRKTGKAQVSESKEMTPEEKLAEARRVVNAHGLCFVKESKKYSGKHPVFDSKKFQDYLLKECGLGCDNECRCETGDECCCDQEVCICPECDGEGCEACNFQGYIENEDPADTVPDDSYNDIDDFDVENDDASFAYGPEESDDFVDDMAMQSFNNTRRGRGPLY